MVFFGTADSEYYKKFKKFKMTAKFFLILSHRAENQYLKDFRHADFGSGLRFWKFKMAKIFRCLFYPFSSKNFYLIFF